MLYDRGKGVVCGAHAREQHIPRKCACHGSFWLRKWERERQVMLYDRGKGVVCGAYAREQHIKHECACHHIASGCESGRERDN